MRRAAPYLYIDKTMEDHGLFQAICRTNRLDGEDKDFGYIVDYKDLFKKLKNAIAVYASELDHSDGSSVDSQILLQEPLNQRSRTIGQCTRSRGAALRAGGAPKGELETHPLFLCNTEIPKPAGTRDATRRPLQGHSRFGSRLCQHRGMSWKPRDTVNTT